MTERHIGEILAYVMPIRYCRRDASIPFDRFEFHRKCDFYADHVTIEHAAGFDVCRHSHPPSSPYRCDLCIYDNLKPVPR